VLKLLSRLARELNWSRRAWSTASDREFHEDLYRSDTYDPFSWAYPGYTTIRRFADLVETSLPARGVVLDLGCGPGEITCELASRRPDLTFIGVDHSAAAIARAHANTARRNLVNIRFECGNVEEYAPPGAIDLVTLFDAFHHLTGPAEFVKRLGLQVKRWALIEPRGSWAGTWRKDLDFDWLAQDLDNIRARIASLAGLKAGTTTTAAATATAAPGFSPAGQAVERRYTLDDFQRFFEGYALDLRGTVAGLDAYPPGANQSGDLRERFGELRYELYRDIDEWLLARNLDLHAKHWLIVAERGGRTRQIEWSALARAGAATPRTAGEYDVRYGRYRGPLDGIPGERIAGAIELTNEGWEVWSSDAEQRVYTSYHWLDGRGHILEFDGERTPLPRAIAAGETCEVALTIRTPSAPGQYRLAIDLVREGVTWFSQAGRPWLEVPFEIRRP
jgi:SAM-dependent methyltransferase